MISTKSSSCSLISLTYIFDSILTEMNPTNSSIVLVGSFAKGSVMLKDIVSVFESTKPSTLTTVSDLYSISGRSPPKW